MLFTNVQEYEFHCAVIKSFDGLALRWLPSLSLTLNFYDFL